MNTVNYRDVPYSEKVKLIRLFILCSVGAVWLIMGLLGFVMSDHAALENISYLAAALVIWFAAVAAHWIGHSVTFAWFSCVVVVVTVWSMQS